jgi:hypothetical protein
MIAEVARPRRGNPKLRFFKNMEIVYQLFVLPLIVFLNKAEVSLLHDYEVRGRECTAELIQLSFECSQSQHVGLIIIIRIILITKEFYKLLLGGV